MVRATALGGRVRALAIDATGVVADLAGRHATEPAVTAALGRLATGALLLGAGLKGADHLVTLRVKGDGPAGQLVASANGRGEVRALVSNPRPGVEQVRNGKLNVAGAVGRQGMLTVTRDLGMREPYAGTVELVSGEIGEDLAHYLLRSEQIPSAVGIGVFVRSDATVDAAGGYMVQVLPELSAGEAASLEETIRALPHPTAMLRAGDAPENILARIFPDGFEARATTPVRFHCSCTRERAERALVLLGEEAIREIIEEEGEAGAELTCEFCTARYALTLEDLRELAARAAA